jgi:hypothetical protein
MIRWRAPGLLLAASVSGALPLAAQGMTYTIRGRVLDLEGAAIQGVELILEDPRLSVLTGADGGFLIEGVPSGRRKLTARRIGFLPVNPVVLVPQGPRDSLRIYMIPLPQQLAPIDVTVERKGIYGVVGDTGYHALPGTLVEVLGGRIADTTDERGRFAFPDLRDGQYMLRFSQVGYYGRLLTVDLYKKGRDFSVILDEYRKGRDWVNSLEANAALADLSVRLATEFRRFRMTREELTRYGSAALCDIPKIRSVLGREPHIILRGSVWYRNASLCGWNADQLDMLEWGVDPCREAWRSVADVLGLGCGATRGQSIMMRRSDQNRGYVVLWPRN